MKKLRQILVSLLVTVTAVSASSQVLYKVEGNGLTSPSYIFGTHHLAPLSMIETFGASEPFNQSKQVIGEIDMTQDQMAMSMAMQPHMMAPQDSTLSKLISPEDFAVINEEFKKWSPMPGVDLRMFDAMKPMVATAMVAVGMSAQAMPGYNPAEQLDTYFQIQGKADGKAIVPLETVEEQAIILYDTTPIAHQAEALVEMLKNPGEAIQSVKDLTEAYNAADLAKMLELSEKEDEHPEFMLALLDRRNANWLTKLPDLMKQAPSFVAVGALHLAGKQGIIEGLRNLGFTVTPVNP